MRVSEAVTQADGLGITLIAFAVLYTVLGITCIYVLLRMFKGQSAEADQLKWYGEYSNVYKGEGGRLS